VSSKNRNVIGLFKSARRKVASLSHAAAVQDTLQALSTRYYHITMKPQTSKKKGAKPPFQKKKSAPFHNKKRKREVTFDPEARRQYLQGFSERKRQRRAYGLAMQKVKDRRSKLEEKKETKQADLERIEQAESQKKELLYEKHGGVIEGDDNDEDDTRANKKKDTTTTTYQDVQTQSQFGGHVIVTTTTMPPSDDDESDVEQEPEKAKHIDAQQRYAGNVNKYLHQLKGNMPGKKKRDHGSKHKGRHGAASMKGMGGAANLKVAQKALSKMQAKNGMNERKGRSGGKRKR